MLTGDNLVLNEGKMQKKKLLTMSYKDQNEKDGNKNVKDGNNGVHNEEET